ncbi:UNKNOWN [Stylonychia lemnae]|uniref:Uncharacterized protein n=1 Tax=Stylonychia lemnae TaxID=5949 RepID=A0A078A345_STYLE|nr:UNKNOWN [Stylonychia lemnae]|eukprot:CDW75189.1 UNKNOWN [Stylonychia lemnae]
MPKDIESIAQETVSNQQNETSVQTNQTFEELQNKSISESEAVTSEAEIIREDFNILNLKSSYKSSSRSTYKYPSRYSSYSTYKPAYKPSYYTNTYSYKPTITQTYTYKPANTYTYTYSYNGVQSDYQEQYDQPMVNSTQNVSENVDSVSQLQDAQVLKSYRRSSYRGYYSGGSVSSGAIAGIVIGSVCLCSFIIGCYVNKHDNHNSHHETHDVHSPSSSHSHHSHKHVHNQMQPQNINDAYPIYQQPDLSQPQGYPQVYPQVYPTDQNLTYQQQNQAMPNQQDDQSTSKV